MSIEKICVVGLGYIGFPTALMFASVGKEVYGVDTNSKIVDMISKGKVHIEEKGLENLLQEVVSTGSLKTSGTPTFSDVFIITVPTPHNSDNTANIDAVVAAIKSILPYLKKGNIVIIESTIPPRTTNDIIAPLIEKSGLAVGKEIYLAYCPERVLPGKILEELVHNTRIIGGINKVSAQKATEVYGSFVKAPMIETSSFSAEMSKLMENTFRDVNIALANEFVKISNSLKIDALEAIKLANHHPRVNIHLPGPGVGGHCLAVDPYFIIEKSNGNAKIISDARYINNSMPEYVVEQLEKIVGRISGKIAVLGIAYKGNIDDVRESPALRVIELLREKEYEINAYDPFAKQSQVCFELSIFDKAIQDAECILVLTDHDEFKNLDEEKILRMCKNPVVFDTKNCVNINDSDIKYYNFGNLHKIEEFSLMY